jgi:hypothetical protein
MNIMQYFQKFSSTVTKSDRRQAFHMLLVSFLMGFFLLISFNFISNESAFGSLKECNVKPWKCENNPDKGDSDRFFPGGGNSSIPYLIAPRYSVIRNQRPTLKWNDMSEKSIYRVSLCSRVELKDKTCSRSKVIRRKEISISKKGDLLTASLSYPNEWNLLEKNEYYRPLIEELTDNQEPSGKTSEDDIIDEKHPSVEKNYPGNERGMTGAGIGFWVDVPDNTNQSVLPLTATVSDLIAEFLKRYLYAEAIDFLEQNFTFYPSQYVHYWLGYLHYKSGLNLLAKGYYEKAKSEFEKSELEEDKKILKGINEDLGRISDYLSTLKPVVPSVSNAVQAIQKQGGSFLQGIT